MTFSPLIIVNGQLLDLSGDEFPTKVYGFSDSALELDDESATHYGMVTQGEAALCDEYGTHPLYAGMYFVLPGRCAVDAARGAGLVISRLGYTGLRQIGGPIEQVGRLRYIDGCTDTLLASPPRMGDPCLNHLHIPADTSQTQHTHPSVRIGVILSGAGECRTPQGVYPLTPGKAWHIPAGCLHSFYTCESSLDVIAWHPDSDFGPTDENHPMLNRTVIR